MISDNLLKIKQLGDLITEKLTPLIDKDYVLLDVPNHRNTGDNLIWEGELEFLKSLPYNKLYGANHSCYDRNKVPSDSIILLHGGGNFGDLYRSSQNLKLQVVEEFKNQRIIIFPQTVFYKNEDNFKNDMKFFSSHKDLYLCVRDTVSYEMLRPYFKDTNLLLLPDMAFCLNLYNEIHKRVNDRILYLKRTDAELNNDDQINTLLLKYKGKKIDVSDWTSYSNNKFINRFILYKDEFFVRLSRFLLKIKALAWLADSEFGMNSKLSRKKHINNGIQFINRYDTVITTRLHGLILSLLLDKEIVLLDNSYGKNSNYYKTWLTGFDNITLLKKNV